MQQELRLQQVRLQRPEQLRLVLLVQERQRLEQLQLALHRKAKLLVQEQLVLQELLDQQQELESLERKPK